MELVNILLQEGNKSVTNCNALKMLSANGEICKTDVIDNGRFLG